MLRTSPEIPLKYAIIPSQHPLGKETIMHKSDTNVTCLELKEINSSALNKPTNPNSKSKPYSDLRTTLLYDTKPFTQSGDKGVALVLFTDLDQFL